MKKTLFKEIYNEFNKHFLVALFYPLAMLPLVNGWWNYILFFLGTILGVGLAISDGKYFYQFYQEETPKTDLKQPEKKVKNFLVTQSPLYLVSLIPLSIFVFTSSGSFLAMGLIAGLLLFLLVEMFNSLDQPTAFFAKFLTGTAFVASKQNLQKLFIGSISFFVILHFLVLI